MNAKTWKRIPQNKSGRQVFDRSKVFHLRFRLNNAVKSEDEVQRLDSDYENLQVSAIVMLNPIEEQGRIGGVREGKASFNSC